MSLKGNEAVHIKHIILGRLVGKIPVLEGSQTYLCRCLLGLLLLHSAVFHNPGKHRAVNIPDQVLQAHDAALAGLKGLSVLPIHGAESQEDHGGALLHDPCLLCHPEHLLKVHSLALIHHIDIPIRMENGKRYIVGNWSVLIRCQRVKNA